MPSLWSLHNICQISDPRWSMTRVFWVSPCTVRDGIHRDHQQQEQLTRIIETKNVILEVCASSGDHHLTLQVLANLVADLTCLQSQLACRHHYQPCIATEDLTCQSPNISTHSYNLQNQIINSSQKRLSYSICLFFLSVKNLGNGRRLYITGVNSANLWGESRLHAWNVKVVFTRCILEVHSLLVY